MATQAERQRMKHARVVPRSLLQTSPFGKIIHDRERIAAAGPEIAEDVQHVIEMIAVATKSCNRQDMFAAAEAFGRIFERVSEFQSTLEEDSPQWAHLDRLKEQMKFEYEAAKDTVFYCFELCFVEGKGRKPRETIRKKK